ncbi:Disease resistance protein [Vigna angularis]|uniref:Disease resistance protein n=1 Tax=Phaseolus angularis TaxID=3914 RepID=A0A8T0JTY1_PHAAN|nr:Disease resistance protein [Vigna angularis]
METVFKIIDPVIVFLWGHGIKQVTYIFGYTKNLEELNKKVKRLGEEKERLDRQCIEARKKGHIVEARVEEWFGEVDEFETSVENYRKNAGHKKTRGLYYLLPYYRHTLGRQAKKMEMEALRLTEESKVDEVSHAEKVTSFDLTSSNSGYIEFDSRKSIVEDIMTKLKDPNMKIIGLHGSQGMGKSTLIRKIAKKAKDEGLFDRVAEIDVTVNPNPLKIQEDIAHVLGLSLAGEGENVRAYYLRRWLKIENPSILIILDNLHEKLDLNRLGIPVDDDYDLRKKNQLSIRSSTQGSKKNSDHTEEAATVKQDVGKYLEKANFLGDYKGYKVLLSSRYKEVFLDEVDVESKFSLQELDDNDALILFEKVTGGDNKISMPKEEIQNYCTGLPMRIVNFAEAFKKWSELENKPTMDKFKNQGLVEWNKSLEIPNNIKYDLPKNEELKFIFFLCAQMGHLPLVNDLVKYCFGLGILEGVSSLSAAREKINESIQELKNMSLVSYKNPNVHFNMSHMVRDYALSNAPMDQNVFDFRDGKLDYWPNLEKCISISICNSDITDGFPKVINCPQLKFLKIETKDPSLEIPKSFFSSMKNLLVLILTGFHLSSLPNSIEDLLNLRMLSLERCTLDCNLSVVRKFKKLRILSFSGSQLKNLPIELRYLDKLRLLDISDCFELEIIPPNLISNLTCLEELYIRKSLIEMLKEREESKGHNAFLSELANLHQLKVVDLSIPCVSILPDHLFFDRLKDYKIEIGDFEIFSVGEFKMPNKYEELKVLALQVKDDTDIHSYEGIKLLFKTTQSLLLGNVGVQNVVNELNIDGFQDLKHLSIINNNDIKYVNSTDLSNCVNIFPNLESLCLYNMMNLKMICDGPMTLESFAKLKTIKVEMCYQLETLFSFYAIKTSTSSRTSEIFECNSYTKNFLASLEMIEVCECKSLKEILQIPIDYDKVEFLKLRTLTLQSLPSFTCFNTKVKRSCWPHAMEAQTTNRAHTEISTEEDDHSDNASPLFGELVEVPNIENLNLSSLNIHKIWSNQHLSSFQNLISSLKKLKSLIISGCPIMENIFEIEGINAHKLEEIHLSDMKRLKDIWHTKVNIDSFSSLISVNIEECNQLDKIFPSHMEGWFESLINLKVSNCKHVKVIFEVSDSEEIDVSGGIDTNLQVILLKDLPKLKELWSKDPHGILNFKKLRTIDVSNCDELKNLFPASMAKDVSKLERISILHCKKMEEIVSSKDASEANNDPLEFPELTYVRLHELENIKQFYKGRHPIKCPKLKELSMDKCMMLKTFQQKTSEEKFVFSAEAVFPNLEYMEIHFEEPQILLSKIQMHNLKELIILNAIQPSDLSYPILYKMPNLEKLTLTSYDYESLESLQSTNIGQQDRLGVVVRLKQLFIRSSDIKDLGFERYKVLQRLEVLSLEFCYELETLAPSSVSLSYLTYLELKACNGLRNLMASSTAQSMVQLKTMKVINCNNLKEIVSNEKNEEGKVKKIVFSKLISIELVRLKNLASFCSYKDYEFEFPSLEILIVRECLKMEKFSEKRAIAPKLKDVFGVEGDQKAKWQWKGDLNATIQKVFDDKMILISAQRKIKEESISNLSVRDIQELCLGSRCIPNSDFGLLESLTLDKCQFLSDVLLPFNLLSFLTNLEKLDVRNCDSVKIIFDVKCTTQDREVAYVGPTLPFSLKKLTLINLPKLKNVWNEDPQVILSMHHLQKVCVKECEGLTSVFPPSKDKYLVKLKHLEVKGCKRLMTIFAEDNIDPRTKLELTCPFVRSLELQGLSSFKYFYYNSLYCEIFTYLESHTMNQVGTEKLFKCLSLGENGVDMILQREFKRNILHNIKALTLCLGSDVFRYKILEKVPNIEKLVVCYGSFKKMFCRESPDNVLQQLKVLRLEFLLELVFIGLENSWTDSFVRNLEIFEVINCPSLKNLVSSTVSFSNLRCLKVKNCPSLSYLLTSSTAKCLGKLKRMEIKWCNSIEEIVSGKLFQVKLFEEVIQVKIDINSTMRKKYLRKLIIPNLEHLTVGKNELKMIVDGEFQRNLLDKLKVLGLCFDIECDEFPDYGFLQQLPNVKKLVVCSSSFKGIFFDRRPNNCELLSQLKELRLESLEELVSIGLENSWTEAFVRKLETFEVISCSSLENLVACTVSFSNLICLKVESCDNLSYMFTSSTAKSLGQVQRMEINNCKSIVEIVSREREETDENEIIFSQLNCLKLDSLLNLRWFYRGRLSFPSLEELSVIDCDVMVTLCPSTLKADKLSQVTIGYDNIPLETNLNSTTLKKFKTEISELEKLELKSRPKLAEIWHEFCFSELATLIVEDCQFLSDEVLPFRLLPLLPKLKTLQVRNCDNVKVIFDVKSTQERLITFPLKKLVLSKLPNLENVWNEDTRGILSMRHLEQVFVDTCKSLKSVFPASIGKELVNLEDLVVKDCEGLMAIVAEESDENEEIIFKRLQCHHFSYSIVHSDADGDSDHDFKKFDSYKERYCVQLLDLLTVVAFTKIMKLPKYNLKFYIAQV